jgi:uncharacterized Ntn-hydrolase superfamily protein
MADLPVLAAALGEGWLGKLIVAGLAGGGAWFLRRPVEKAAVMALIDARVEKLFVRQDKWIDHITDAHKACEEHLERVSNEVEQLRGELRQEKQVSASISRLKSDG